MGRTRTGLGGLAAALLLLFAGCKNDSTLKPPKEDSVYRLPPNESRYSGYPQFPDGTLNKFPKRELPPGQDDPSAGPASRFGMGAPGH